MKSTKAAWHRYPGARSAFVIVVAMLISMLAVAQAPAKPAPDTELPPGSAALMQPEELVKILQAGGAKPVIFYVGPRFVYGQAHVPGAEFIGPASEAQSLDRLRKRAASLAKNSPIVLYCGCCPWEHCPNIRPAHTELQKMGFTNVKALYLANSLGTNWVDKGYPVEKGEPR